MKRLSTIPLSLVITMITMIMLMILAVNARAVTWSYYDSGTDTLDYSYSRASLTNCNDYPDLMYPCGAGNNSTVYFSGGYLWIEYDLTSRVASTGSATYDCQVNFEVHDLNIPAVVYSWTVQSVNGAHKHGARVPYVNSGDRVLIKWYQGCHGGGAGAPGGSLSFLAFHKPGWTGL